MASEEKLQMEGDVKMQVNAMTEEFEHIELFGKPVLFTNARVDKATVPEGWYRYNIRGSDYDPGSFGTLEREVAVNHAGTMERISKELLEFLRRQYPRGSRIRLREMGTDDPRPIQPGSKGTLEHIDDIGTFHIRWDDGRGLGLVIGQDSFTVLPPESTLLKLYMPLTAELYERNKYGDMEDIPAELGGRELRSYEGEILKALQGNRMPEESESGLMHWYDKGDSVEEKVRSVVFTVEEKDGRLWGVAECQVVGTLTPEEMTALTNYIAGQASDGWGEGFEQREILVEGDSELYVHFWNSDSWSIMTEEERFSHEQDRTHDTEHGATMGGMALAR